jgi:hypothetical protein
LKREPTTKINKPHLQGSAGSNINASTLVFFEIELLVINMQNENLFVVKVIKNIFLLFLLLVLKLAFIHTHPPNFIPHFPWSRMFLASQKRNGSVFEKRTSSAVFKMIL